MVDSWDTYAIGDTTLRWTYRVSDRGQDSLGTGRTGKGWVVPATPWSDYVGLGKVLTSEPTWVVGFAVNAAWGAGTAETIICQFADAGTSQLQLTCNNAGKLSAYRGGGVPTGSVSTGATLGTLLGQSANGALPTGTWHYLELLGTIDPTAGVVTVRVDGQQVISLTGQNTRASANGSADTIWLWAMIGGGVQATFDDLYLCDGTGAANNTFLGDVRVAALLPNAAGNYSQLAPTGAGTNHGCVGEATEDGDTTYVSSATAGQKDSYLTPALAGTGTVKGVQLGLVARKDDAGTRTIQPLVRQAATDALGTAVSLGNSYQQYLTPYDTNPATAGAWAFPDLGTAEFGVVVAS